MTAVTLTIGQRVLLVAASALAGTIDAIGGGGGLITLPALLAAGLPPHFALATNKGQSVFGSGSAMIRYARGGLIPWRRARWLFPIGIAGALLGSRLVLVIDPAVLRPIILGLLIAVAVFLAFRRSPERRVRGASAGRVRAMLAIAALIAAYDGFFGPGTGTFLIVAFVSVLGVSLPEASAEAKVVNCASNVAALGMFASHGLVLWTVALPMAAAQLFAGTLGAHLAIRGGDRWVRRVVLGVVLAFCVKLAHDLLVR